MFAKLSIIYLYIIKAAIYLIINITSPDGNSFLTRQNTVTERYYWNLNLEYFTNDTVHEQRNLPPEM